MKFNFNIPVDNLDAHNDLRQVMCKGEKLHIRFDTDSRKYPYARIESDTINLKYWLNKDSQSWLMQYLETGQADDLFVSPNAITAYTKSVSYQIDILEEIYKSGKHIKKIPTYRDRAKHISMMAVCHSGTIFFRIPVKGELADYLQSKNINL